MLAWLLDPEGSHGLHELFLRRWLMQVLNEAADQGRPLDWTKPKGQTKRFYCPDIMKEFDKHYTKRKQFCRKSAGASLERQFFHFGQLVVLDVIADYIGLYPEFISECIHLFTIDHFGGYALAQLPLW